jgi:hypothetical protein
LSPLSAEHFNLSILSAITIGGKDAGSRQSWWSSS